MTKSFLYNGQLWAYYGYRNQNYDGAMHRLNRKKYLLHAIRLIHQAIQQGWPVLHPSIRAACEILRSDEVLLVVIGTPGNRKMRLLRCRLAKFESYEQLQAIIYQLRDQVYKKGLYRLVIIAAYRCDQTGSSRLEQWKFWRSALNSIPRIPRRRTNYHGTGVFCSRFT